MTSIRNKWLIFLAIALLPISVRAETLAVEDLYDMKSHIPTALIPLRLKGDLIDQGGVLIEAVANSTAGTDCRVKQDPFIRNIILLKCASETEVSVVFKVKKNGKVVSLNYGPLEIKMPAAGVEIVAPKGGLDPAEVLRGKQLYNVYCVRCHSNPVARAGRTSEQIKNAAFSKFEMRDLKSALNAADYKYLETYLKSF